MTITSLKTEKESDLRRIEFSDGSLFSFRICYLPKEAVSGEIEEGCEITSAQEEGFRFASACLRAEKSALLLIARAEQCTLGLSSKLKRKKHESSCINAVIERLTGLNLINDERYASLWIDSRLRLSRSPRRLLTSLCGRGIDRDDAQSALNAALTEEAEYSMLLRYVKKYPLKARQKGDDEAKSLKYVLKSEGFSMQAISRFFNEE